MPLIHTKILLPISFRSLLIHVYLTRSVIVFCIGRALPIRCVRVIRKSSRYTLEFDGFLFPCQFTGQIDWHVLIWIKCGPSLAYGILELYVWLFRVNRLIAGEQPSKTAMVEQTLPPRCYRPNPAAVTGSLHPPNFKFPLEVMLLNLSVFIAIWSLSAWRHCRNNSEKCFFSVVTLYVASPK